MMSIRIHIGLVVSLIFLISCNSCDPICLDGGNDTTIQIEVPFDVSPQKEVYQIGDTITLSLFMDEYYSLSTDESLPIQENLIKDYLYYFLDSNKQIQSSNPYFPTDSFDFILDTNARRFKSSSGFSAIVFFGDFIKEKGTISFTSSIIPQVSGFYVLHVAWVRSSSNLNLIDLTDDCGREYYTLESMINGGKKDMRNTHLVENDTTLLRQTLDDLYSEQSVDSILNIPNLYYFYVEE